MRNLLYFLSLAFLLPVNSIGQEKNAPVYKKTEVMIPMRDGVKLFTVIYAPENQPEKEPILFFRTPYGASTYPDPEQFPPLSNYLTENYIFVFQDIRGRNKSEGEFLMNRPLRDKTVKEATDETTDTYDAIDWMVKNIPGNNQKVCLKGASYDGWAVVMGVIDPHPSLVAAVEEAAMGDAYIGDDFFHNGAFRLSYALEYSYSMENKTNNHLILFPSYDRYDYYLELGSLSQISQSLKSNIPTWNNFIAHPVYDEFWQKRALANNLKSPVVPMLNVAGWWDQEDFYGPQKVYDKLEKADMDYKNFMVIGPWNHGGWYGLKGDSLGRIRFGSATAKFYRDEIEFPFINYYLKGKGTLSFPEAYTFQTGTNQWKKYDKWPPENLTTNQNLYLSANKCISLTSLSMNDSFDEYISDPKHPIPYRSRPIEKTYGPGSRWYTWLTEDQRFVDNRPDVLTWETESLSEDLEVTGNIMADIFASTTGTDADWVVKLIDVYPDMIPDNLSMSGYELMIANDVFRGRYRNGFTQAKPITANAVLEYKIDLHAINHVFQKGHRIMVQIQSTWFPLIDRNPQKFVPNIFEAGETDFISATHRIYHTKEFPSHIQLPVVSKK